MISTRISFAIAALLLTPALASCADDTESTSSAAATDCDLAAPPLKTDGKLVIGTDSPAYDPWFSEDDPTNGKGYESAVGYAIADQLGIEKDDVSWVTVAFDTAYAPGDKKFDFDLNQVSITEERKSAVDLSDSYLDLNQALVTVKGSPIDGATSIADLKDAKIGVQVGTTSLEAVTTVISPNTEPQVFNNTADATSALTNGQVDGIVVDLPTGFYIANAELDEGVIVGQFPNAEGTATDSFGATLEKGSPLTGCVNEAIANLKADGTLAKLAETYLAEAGAPVLK